MKKATLPGIISTAIVCYVFWLLLTGQLVDLIKGEPAPQLLIAGVIVSIGVALFTARFFIHEKAFYLFNPVRFISLIGYFFIFLVELTKANVDVAIRALSPKLRVNPGIVKVPVELKSEYGESMLANSITLTPGTITMDIAEQDEKTWYYIHWIDVKDEDPEKAGEAIKGTLERGVRRIWK